MASSMMEKLRGNWQEGKTLPQCNLFLMECGYSDVTFRVYYKDELNKEQVADIPAIRVLCLARSPVFFALFEGELAQERDKSIHEIRDDHVDPDAFKCMLKYMYCDNVTLTADNVLAVMYLAQKYIVSTLITRCLRFLEENLTANTAPVLLEQAMLYGEKELEEKTLALIEEEAAAVLASEEFMDLSQQALHQVLKLNLRVDNEVAVFSACVKWAEKQCQKLQKSANGENIREILGENLFQIRFPTMSLSDLTEVVAPRDVLTGDEGFQVIRFISSASHKPEHLPFPVELRVASDPTPRTLLVPEPYTSATYAFGSKDVKYHTTSLACTMSAPICLRKIYVSAADWPGRVKSVLKISVKQNGASLHEYTGEPATITDHQQLPHHFVVDVDGVRVKSGAMELYIEQKVTRKDSGRNSPIYAHQYSSPEVTQISDSCVTIEFPSTNKNLLLGIVYSIS